MKILKNPFAAVGILLAIFIVFSCSKSKDTTAAPPKKIEPTVTTDAMTNITSTSLLAAGTIVDTGARTWSIRGFILSSINSTPDQYSNEKFTYTPYAPGFSYSENITGLNPNTTYYIRAYCSMTYMGVGYWGLGQVKSFKTLP